MRLARAVYRSKQVLHALHPTVDSRELQTAMRLLTERQAALFRAMPKGDQRHALEVMRRLQDDAATPDRDLLVAALLHDCGKGHVPVWLRILNVLSPAAVSRVAGATDGGWRRSAYRLRNHARLGAALAEQAGSPPPVVRLIAGTPLPEEERRLQRLQAADDSS